MLPVLFLAFIAETSAVYAEAGRMIWKYQTGGGIYSSPAIGADGTVYIGSSDQYLHAVKSDGTPLWKYLTGGAVFSSPAVAADGTVYVGSDDHYLYAVNPDGTLKWRYEKIGGEVKSSPAIGDDGTVYVGSMDGTIYAIDPDGNPKWSYATGSNDVNSSPAVGADGLIYAGCTDKQVYALMGTSGTLMKKYPTGGIIKFSSPALWHDGTVYIGAWDGKLYALNPDRTVKWTYTTDDAIESSPAVGAEGTVYMGSMDGNLYAVNPDGSLKWKYQACENCSETVGIFSSPAIGMGGTVYAGSMDTYLYAVRQEGTLQWRYKTDGAIYSSPAVKYDNTVYVGSEDGYLYAIEGDLPWPYNEYPKSANGYALSAWPKFGQNNLNLRRVPILRLTFPEKTEAIPGQTVSLPVTLDNIKNESVYNLSVSIHFEQNKIEIKKVTSAETAAKITTDNLSGQISIRFPSGSVSAPYTMQNGNIAELEIFLTENAKIGEDTTLTFSEAKINSLPVTTQNGIIKFVPAACQISGNAAYFKDKSPVSDVTLALAGKNSYTETTDATGNYTFSGVPPGDYTLTPSKTGDLKGLSALDAAKILQHARSKIQLNCAESKAADVNKDSQINETDAVAVAKCSGERELALECQMNESKINWAFVSDPDAACESQHSALTFAPLESDKTDADFVSMLLGDVSGNWYAQNRTPATKDSVLKDILPVIEIKALPEGTISIPLALAQETAAMLGVDLVIQYDNDALELAEATLTGGILDSWKENLQVIKDDKGFVAIKIYGADEITGAGNVLFLKLKVIGALGATASLSIEKLECNETAVSGGFGVNDSIALQVNVVIKYEAGDIDHSKVIDLRDAVLALRVSAGVTGTEKIFLDADTNGDEKIGTEDVSYILQVISGLRSSQ